MKKIILSTLLGAMALPVVQAQEIKPFQDGDRVVFLGNSITDGGLYHSYIWLYYMTRFPDLNIKIMNGGICQWLEPIGEATRKNKCLRESMVYLFQKRHNWMNICIWLKKQKQETTENWERVF